MDQNNKDNSGKDEGISVEEILNQVKVYKETVVEKTKSLTTEQIPIIMKLSVNDKQSLKALGDVIGELNKIEQILFEVSIVKMELRSLFSEIPRESRETRLYREVQKALNIVGDCNVIAKTRYDYVGQVLGTVKSINSNLRLTTKFN